ncbi:MAG: FAD-dependent oxidoreductase [Burkholderiaceae bacterium]
MSDRVHHLAIVGGGVAGASTAVQAVRRSPVPLRVTLFEPRAELGRGLAYRTTDPDHRINAHLVFHPIDPTDIGQVMRWLQADDLLARDPEALCAFGVFPRRAEFGRYLHESVQAHMTANPSGSTIIHDRRMVRDLHEQGGRVRIETDDGASLEADAVVVAIGNPPPRVPPLLAPVAGHRACVSDPLAERALDTLDPDAAVLVMGTSLTAADTLASLIRRGHRGPITAFSRRGLRPRAQRPPDPSIRVEDLTDDWLLGMMMRPMADFLLPPDGGAPTLRFLIRALRQRIRETAAQGQAWQLAFDDLRDAVWRFWPRMADAEKRRFIRRVRVWYDVHRFRIPPQTQALLDRAQADGRLRFARYGLEAVSSAGSERLRVSLAGRDGRLEAEVGALINCTGLDMAAAPAPGSLAANWLADGRLQPHPCGFGYRFDDDCRPVAADGGVPGRIRFVGPVTVGHFGDPLGAIFIVMQIHRMLPGLLGKL